MTTAEGAAERTLLKVVRGCIRSPRAYSLRAMQSLSNERRQAKKARRHQVRRRRIVAIAVVVPLVIGAIWAAYAWPAPKPARVPAANVVSQFGQAGSVDRRIVVARLESIDLLLPVKLEATTAVAFHPGRQRATAWRSRRWASRATRRASPGTLADLFANGGMRYYVMGGDASDASDAAPPASTWGRCPAPSSTARSTAA